VGSWWYSLASKAVVFIRRGFEWLRYSFGYLDQHNTIK